MKKLFYLLFATVALSACGNSDDDIQPQKNANLKIEILQEGDFLNYDKAFAFAGSKGSMSAPFSVNMIDEKTGKKDKALVLS